MYYIILCSVNSKIQIYNYKYFILFSILFIHSIINDQKYNFECVCLNFKSFTTIDVTSYVAIKNKETIVTLQNIFPKIKIFFPNQYLMKPVLIETPKKKKMHKDSSKFVFTYFSLPRYFIHIFIRKTGWNYKKKFLGRILKTRVLSQI